MGEDEDEDNVDLEVDIVYTGYNVIKYVTGHPTTYCTPCAQRPNVTSYNTA